MFSAFTIALLLSVCCTSMDNHTPHPPWGFYGHQLINRMAVFTIPADLIILYKENIDYISAHAVDPDKRRYANPHEAVRHYIDLDHGGEDRSSILPRTWHKAVLSETHITCITGDNPVLTCLKGHCTLAPNLEFSDSTGLFDHLHELITPWGFDEESLLTYQELRTYISGLDSMTCRSFRVGESLSQFGILPYYLAIMQQRLTRAFANKEITLIIKHSADIGHYLADAHVPLHTSENYNGQLTGQLGIHAFWESRIPELFAEQQYDYLVGKAEYISDPVQYFWDVVLESHSHVDRLLSTEMKLRETYPEDQRFCFDARNDIIVRTQCEDYAAEFQDNLEGMVEARMRKAIKAVGSAWFTAWVDAGQPLLDDYIYQPDSLELFHQTYLEEVFKKGQIKGRPHQ